MIFEALRHRVQNSFHILSFFSLNEAYNLVQNITDSNERISNLMASNAGVNELLCLPSNEEGLERLKRQTKRDDERGLHLINLVENSYKINRPIGQTTILLVGRSGAGKSTFINNFFAERVCPSSSLTACTKKTQEYIATSCSEKLGIRDLTLACIDTPGFGDSGGDLQSVRNVLSTKKFFATHSKYQLKQKIYPNVVLVVHNASDNRMEGHESKLAQTIKSLSAQDVIDHKHPNVLMVFTNACGVLGKDLNSTADGYEMFQSFGEVYNIATELFATYLQLKPPIYFVENMAEKFSLPTESNCDWTILPCGTKQLFNVFDGMKNLLLQNGDSLAAATVGHYFSDRKTVKVVEGHSCEVAKGRQTAEEKDLEEILYPEEDPDLNEVEEIILDSAEELDGEDASIVNEAQNLSRILTVRGVNTAEELKSKSLKDIAGVIFPLPLTSSRQKIISRWCTSRTDDRPARTPRIYVGQGYDVFKDQPLARDIYIFDGHKKQMTHFNMLIPEEIIVKVMKKETFTSEVFPNLEKYLDFRLKLMGVECKIKPSLTINDVKSGFVIREGDADNKPSLFVQEHLEYSLSMNPYADALNPDFIQYVKSLPDEYIEHENRQQFELFFAKWGHFVITEVYCGGTVQGTLNKKIWSVDRSEMQHVQAGVNVMPFVETNTVILEGGTKEPKHISQKNVFENWLSSLKNSPTILTSRMKLKPIWECIQQLSLQDSEFANKRDAIRKAQESLLSMKTTIPDTREAASGILIDVILRMKGFSSSLKLFTTMKNFNIFPNLAMCGLCVIEDIQFLSHSTNVSPDDVIQIMHVGDGLTLQTNSEP